MGEPQVTDKGIEHLTNFAKLTWLDCSNCKQITRKAVQTITKLTNLRYIFQNIRQHTQSHNHTIPLSHLICLIVVFYFLFRRLRLSRCSELNDQCIPDLLKLTNLTELDLTESGISKELAKERFKRIKNLRV